MNLSKNYTLYDQLKKDLNSFHRFVCRQAIRNAPPPFHSANHGFLPCTLLPIINKTPMILDNIEILYWFSFFVYREYNKSRK